MRYPENMIETELFNTNDLRYLGEKGSDFFTEVLSDVKNIKKEIVKYLDSEN